MSALIIDPALHSLGGHHYNAVERLQAELGRQGVSAPCLAAATADASVVGELDAVPVFTRSVYGRSYADGEFAEAVDIADRELSAALPRGGLPGLVILPCCDAVLAAALARRVRRAWWRRPPLLLAWLLYGPHHLKAPDDPAASQQQGECRDAYSALATAVGRGGRVRAFCETPALAAHYHALTGWPIGVLPGPALDAGNPAARKARDGGRPTVSCTGFANRAKGYDLLPDAIAHVRRHRPDVRFAIHGIVAGTDSAANREIFARLAALGDGVTVREGTLSSDEYGAWLAGADLLLLPYDPDVYRARGSGVFTDARSRGVPVVAPRGCDFARPAFDEGWGVAIESHSPDSLAAAILAALADLPGLADRAREQATLVHDSLGDILRTALEDVRTGRSGGLGDRFRRLAARIA